MLKQIKKTFIPLINSLMTNEPCKKIKISSTIRYWFFWEGEKKRNYTIVINSELYLYNKNIISFSFFFLKKYNYGRSTSLTFFSL
jgi:hypothetical protein